MTKKKTSDEPQPEDVPQDEPYKPMAVPEPDPIERLAALELRMAQMEKAVSQHNRYHFGPSTGHP
jgi:hypothetical protein